MVKIRILVKIRVGLGLTIGSEFFFLIRKAREELNRVRVRVGV